MHGFRPMARAVAVVFAFAVAGNALAGDLDDLIGTINVSARADLGGFKAELGATFGVSGTKIDGLFEVMSDPADVYMALRIGELTRQPVDRVLEQYRSNPNRGWGAIAHDLGIKPGSEEFHALKQNRLSARANSGSGEKGAKGKGKG
ncbi:MAG TPA: hypothetical protein VD788_07585 [Candidatus Polarisedimenticolaceae bacterium]|nr:hypothetical protein [Candidatus Polarisedimenticolaceae bacterium]